MGRVISGVHGLGFQKKIVLTHWGDTYTRQRPGWSFFPAITCRIFREQTLTEPTLLTVNRKPRYILVWNLGQNAKLYFSDNVIESVAS